MFPSMAELVKERLIKKFEDEIHALDRELKVELPREILRARELGDLRENAEYHAAKERQRLVESRISMLQKRVSEIALPSTSTASRPIAPASDRRCTSWRARARRWSINS
jgi:transcription elongation GreA/GreB family factor